MAQVKDDEYLSSPTSTWDEDKEYNVQEIVSEKLVKGRSFYLVKWEDYSEHHNTWEPEESFVAPLPLEMWAQRKELEKNGLLKPFDIKRWERERAAREKRKQAQRKRKTTTKLRNTRSKHANHTDIRLPSSSEEELDGLSEDSEPFAESLEKLQHLQPRSSKSEFQTPGSNARATHKEAAVRSSAQAAKQRPAQAATNRIAPVNSAAAATGGHSDAKQIEIIRANKSNESERQRHGENVPKKTVKVTKPENVTSGKPPSNISTDRLGSNPSTSQNRTQLVSHPNILGDNWNKSKKKLKNLEKIGNLDAVPYKTMRWQRRAEKRGRDEPEPNIEHLEFIDLNKSPSAAPHRPHANQKQTALKNITRDKNANVSDGSLLKDDTQEPQMTEDRQSIDGSKKITTVAKRQIPLAPAALDQGSSFSRADDGADAEAEIEAIVSPLPALASSKLPLLSRPKINFPCQDRGITSSDTRSEVPKSLIADDRGVAVSETYRLADPIPFKSLLCNIKPYNDPGFVHNPVYGYTFFDSLTILVELACATSGIRRLLLEQKDGNRNEVLFPCTHSITSEEYQGLLHGTESIYFGAGHVKGRADRSSNISTQHAEQGLMLVASELRNSRSAAMFFGDLFSLVIWPSGDPSWKFLDNLFAIDSHPTALRFLARLPIKVDVPPGGEMLVQDFDPQFEETPQNSKQLLKNILGIDWDHIDKDKSIQHLFLLYLRNHRREHDIIHAYARHVGLTVWSSMEPGHWAQFCTQIAGASGQNKPTHRQRGTVLTDISFTQFGYLPRLFRLIHRGTKFFAIDTAQKEAKGQLVRHEYLSEIELFRQGRNLQQMKILEGKANLQSCGVDLLYSVPPKLATVELFPTDRGTAILLLDSVMIRNPFGAYKVLQWLKSQGAGKRHRLISRPKLREWTFRIATEIRTSGKDESLALAWERLRDIATDLISLGRTTVEEQNLQEDHYSPVICLPVLGGSDDYHTYEAYSRSNDLIRHQDQILFELFAAWTIKEIRLFRRFQVITAGYDMKDFDEIHRTWTKRWKYIAMIRDEEFVRGLDTSHQ